MHANIYTICELNIIKHVTRQLYTNYDDTENDADNNAHATAQLH